MSIWSRGRWFHERRWLGYRCSGLASGFGSRVSHEFRIFASCHNVLLSFWLIAPRSAGCWAIHLLTSVVHASTKIAWRDRTERLLKLISYFVGRHLATVWSGWFVPSALIADAL